MKLLKPSSISSGLGLTSTLVVVCLVFDAFGAAGMGRGTFAEAENVGGGALDKDAPVASAPMERTTAESFAPGQQTFDRGWEFRLKDSAIHFNKVGIGGKGNDNGVASLLASTGAVSEVVLSVEEKK